MFQRFLKKDDGSFIIAMDWTKNNIPSGFFISADMDPDTAYTDAAARVYVLEQIVPDPTTTMDPGNTQSSDMGISQTIGMSSTFKLTAECNLLVLF